MKLVLAALLGISLFASSAFACGPNSRECQLHHEHCNCGGQQPGR
jgi:hypothetical protein